MLAAEKAALKTNLAVDTLEIREKEMTHYSNVLGSVSTQATLLAGFSFSQLTGYEFILPDQGYFSKDALDALGIGHVAISDTDTGIGGWTWFEWLTQLNQLVFIISTALCMFLQLWVVQSCTITSVMGQGLALRGPDGSVDRAMRHMARQSKASYALFSLGISLVKVSTILFLINAFSIFISIPCCLICITISWKSYQSEQVLLNIFKLPTDELISSALVDHHLSSEHCRHQRRQKVLHWFSRTPCIGGCCKKIIAAQEAAEAMAATHVDNEMSIVVTEAEEAEKLIARTQEVSPEVAAARIQRRYRGSVHAKAAARPSWGGARRATLADKVRLMQAKEALEAEEKKRKDGSTKAAKAIQSAHRGNKSRRKTSRRASLLEFYHTPDVLHLGRKPAPSRVEPAAGRKQNGLVAAALLAQAREASLAPDGGRGGGGGGATRGESSAAGGGGGEGDSLSRLGLCFGNLLEGSLLDVVSGDLADAETNYRQNYGDRAPSGAATSGRFDELSMQAARAAPQSPSLVPESIKMAFQQEVRGSRAHAGEANVL